MNPKNIVAFITEAIYPHLWLIAGSILLAFILALGVSLGPYLFKLMLDNVTGANLNSHDLISNISKLAVFYIAFLALISVITKLSEYLSTALRSKVEKNIVENMLTRLLDHSHRYFQNRTAEALTHKVNETMRGVPDIISVVINGYLKNILALSIAFITFWQSSPEIAMLLCIWSIIFICISYVFSFQSLNLLKHDAEVGNVVTHQLADILNNIFSVTLLNGKKLELKKMSLLLADYIMSRKTSDGHFLIISSIKNLSFIIYQAFCLYFLIIGFKNSTITSGDFALVIMINIAAFDILISISTNIEVFSGRAEELNDAFDTIYQPIEIIDNPDSKQLVIKTKPIELDDIEVIGDKALLGGRITFQSISFGYNPQNLLFNNLSVTIQPGTKVGLVGYVGSGKTSFVNLILRLRNINFGKILIDDQDIREVSLESLRAAIGIIPQDLLLFHRSLEENIGYGINNATEEEIIAAARYARADEFIESLPNKYKSLVDGKGLVLTGDQRQRIAIARCILKNAPILIMDEATNGLDSPTGSYIQESLLNIMQGRTTMVVAHRLSTLMHMDRILVFDKGKIVEDGSHAELLERGKLYATLWETQINGFLPQRPTGKDVI